MIHSAIQMFSTLQRVLAHISYPQISSIRLIYQVVMQIHAVGHWKLSGKQWTQSFPYKKCSFLKIVNYILQCTEAALSGKPPFIIGLKSLWYSCELPGVGFSTFPFDHETVLLHSTKWLSNIHYSGCNQSNLSMSVVPQSSWIFLLNLKC